MEELEGVPPGSDDLPFQLRQVAYQRVGWTLVFLFLLAAVLGVFGSGLYSSRTEVGRTFGVQYERVLRQDTPGGLTIRLFQMTKENAIQLSVNAAYLSRVTVERITPAPSKSEITETGTTWTIDVSPESARGELYLTLKPDQPGAIDLQLRLGSETLSLKQFILP